MIAYNKLSLVVSVARLYYENGFGQGEIAKQLNISRSYVSKLLTMAKEENIVIPYPQI